MRGHESLVSLKPCGQGLVLEMLRYADEVDKAASHFRDVADQQPADELLELAATLIDKKSAGFAPEQFEDRYVQALRELVDRKSRARGGTALDDVDEPAASTGNVIDLMAALKRSVGDGGDPGSGRSRNSSSRKTAVGKKSARCAGKARSPSKKSSGGRSCIVQG